MRFRAGPFLFLSLLLIAIGCRKPLTPNVDRNQAPETWISAAPQDTLTTRDPQGNPLPPTVGTIAVRFHPYWAGADRDGEIAGFYYAVVETLPLPPPGLTNVPPLPGPKPQDYRFTTKTDTTFIFTVSEAATDRQHAFFVYAVDNQGKPDPTPARVIFNALDRFPPLPVIESATGKGPIYRVDGNGVVTVKDTTVFITDSLTIRNFASAPRETVGVNARLDFSWHGEPTIAGTYVTGYKYKLDESQFVSVDSSVHSVSYNTGVNGDIIKPGKKVFTLRVIDQAQGSRETNRRFLLNFPPYTWFSGPDSNGVDKRNASLVPVASNQWGERWIDGPPNWGSADRRTSQSWTFPNSWLSCDSLVKRPGERPERKTFVEIWDPDGSGPAKDRVFVRSENDTVHLGSFVILYNGGSDLDSPYNVRVSSLDPELPDTAFCGVGKPALTPAGPNGSAIGFRSVVRTFKEPNGPISQLPFSNPYPVFDPLSTVHNSTTSSVNEMTESGRAYAWVRAIDGNGSEDESVGEGRELVRAVESGAATDSQRTVRNHHVLTFYVDKSPALLLTHPAFLPKVGQTYTNRQIAFNLVADDVDWYDPNYGTGGRSNRQVLRWRVWILGHYASGDTAVFRVTQNPDGSDTTFVPQTQSPQVTIPNTIVDTDLTVRVQICDCEQCETTAGQGRCVVYNIPIHVPAPTPLSGQAAPEMHRSRPGPGNSSDRKVAAEDARRRYR